ncbi:MAG TPA: hypothetical protein VJC17_03095 [Candidatus Dojkabacteria bacterium]|nr:hypothetical protein [Candidatus Dojkabacteria bacterium]
MKKGIQSAKEILLKTNFLERILDQKKYIHQEFQDFGLRLAARLEDLHHKSLYINLTKNLPRFLLEQASEFALDYPKKAARAKIFMWKLHGLCQEKNLKFPSGKKRIVKIKRNILKNKNRQISLKI